ncbi:unnamed protein product [Dimorphilus gyrociliatus]|nr:unnamed protein product [Dimorphilus gyrociliatus]
MKTRLTTTRSNFILILIWFASILLALPQLVVARAMRIYPNNSDSICYEFWPNHYYRNAYTITISLTTYVVPLTALSIAYSVISFTLYRRRLPGVAVRSRDELQLTSRKKVIKMLVAVVIAFAVCWAPLNVFNVLNHLWPNAISPEGEYFISYFSIAHFIAMFHSAINPFIYSFLSEPFRKDLKNLITGHCYKKTLRNSNKKFVYRACSRQTEQEAHELENYEEDM